MAKTSDIPVFGCLSGVKVLIAASAIAGPFAGQLMAEQGADVTQIEYLPDSVRQSLYVEQERKNFRSLALNYNTSEGREVLLKLIKDTDIFIEGSRGGTFDKMNLSDEVLWKQNPALVIVHISGFGQTGDPDYVGRASWDAIGQAFSGYMYLNGYPDHDPIPAAPYTCDYATALWTLWSALTGYIKAQKTGKGESIDVAQYEVMVRMMSRAPIGYLNGEKQIERAGSGSPVISGYTHFKCKDGNLLYVAFVGHGPMKGGMALLGLDFGSEEWPVVHSYMKGSELGNKLEKKIEEFCAARTVEEAEREFIAAGVPCSPVMHFELMVNHPHYQARKVFTEWDKVDGEKIKGVNIFPIFKNNPGKIWRGAPSAGGDNEDILTEAGYTAEEIKALYEKKVLKQTVGV